MKISETISL